MMHSTLIPVCALFCLAAARPPNQLAGFEDDLPSNLASPFTPLKGIQPDLDNNGLDFPPMDGGSLVPDGPGGFPSPGDETLTPGGQGRDSSPDGKDSGAGRPSFPTPGTETKDDDPVTTAGPGQKGGSNDTDDTGLGDYMQVVNEWRTRMSRENLTQDTSLETATRGACRKGDHDALDQVMGAFIDTFQRFFLSCLCERPELPGIGEETCQREVNVPRTGDGSITGHADALSSQEYTKIGCARIDSCVSCNLAK
ncbi:hypothetical protein CDD83_2346 [Cordyceps sp. RAO-2017]|nr:hypothetical protein CDD83_2346 [Cordyceps sp. RAO-2017]